MKWTMGITQWSLPGNRDYTLRLAKQLGFDAVQLEFGSWENGMALSHSRLRNLYREESQELGIQLLPLTINALCRYGVVNGLDTADPLDCSTPGLPVHHQLPVFTQTHVC